MLDKLTHVNNSLQEFLTSLKFPIDTVIFDGVMRRFGRKRGWDEKDGSCWVIGFQNQRVKGGTYEVVIVGDHKTKEKHKYQSEKLSPYETGVVNKQLAQAREEAERVKAASQEEAAILAAKIYTEARDVTLTPYMIRKQINGLYGAAISKNILIVPMRNLNKRIVSIQRIFPDGQKRFLAGGMKKGCFHLIGSPGMRIYVAEGFATAVSVHRATGDAVAVAFDAGNLLEVVKSVRYAYPYIEKITIAGDDDWGSTKNTGRVYATNAAVMCETLLAFPAINQSLDVGISDFNDIHLKYGLEKVKEMLLADTSGRGFKALGQGMECDKYYFYIERTCMIIKLSRLNSENLLKLAPKSYWQEHYANMKGAIDWLSAASDTIEESEEAGIFSESRVRGDGFWRESVHTDGADRDVFVLNTGDTTYLNGKQTRYPSQHYFYVKSNFERIGKPTEAPLTAEGGQKLISACQKFQWNNKTDAMLLAGWIAICRLGSALPVRPHIWITGGHGTGKSTLIEELVTKLTSPLAFFGSSTEAGIRQTVKHHSLPVVFDEFEANNSESAMRLGRIIELLRNAWSESASVLMKGGADGRSTGYHVAFCACLASIRVSLPEAADRSRFSILELVPHGSAPERRRELLNELESLTEFYGKKLFARSMKNIRVILDSFELISQSLATRTSQRYGQQTGMLLAGAWSLTNDVTITTPEAEILAAQFIANAESKEPDVQPDHELCLNHLLTTKVTLRRDIGCGAADQKVAELAIGEAIMDDFWSGELLLYGIYVKDDHFSVAKKHAMLGQIFRGTNWADKWADSLKRCDGAKVPDGRTTFGSRHMKQRAVVLPKILCIS